MFKGRDNFVRRIGRWATLRAKLHCASDFTELEKGIINSVTPYTMTGPDRLHALMRATAYVIQNGISGAIVESGVWKGGSMLAVVKTLVDLRCNDRDLYLFDTFEGMAQPTDADVSHKGAKATDTFEREKIHEQSSSWCNANLEEVQTRLSGAGYAREKIYIVKGRVQETIPEHAPSEIALLRLDTDWYESTRHEMMHLFPRLVSGGVIIIDDYGHWKGCRKAVDEYLEEHNIKILLNRIDYTGRIGVKL